MTHLRSALLFSACMLLAACGQSEAEAQREARIRAEAKAELDKAADDLRKTVDGSGLGAVRDLMNDPAIAHQINNPPPPKAETAPTQAPPVTLAPAPISQEAQGLALCRAMLAMRQGKGAGAPRPQDIQTAANDLASDPGALGKCSAQMR